MPNVEKSVIVAPTTTVIKVAAKDKVVYSKEGNNIVKETTTYDVNPENGNITENTTKEMFKENGLKDKVDVEIIQSPIKYVKDTTREKGQENITVPGKAGSTTITTTYTVNRETGEVTSNVGKPVIVASTTTIIKVAAKDKVEVVQRKNGKKVKVTTVYTVDEKTGNITQTEREEEISREVITSKSSDEKVPTIELKPFEGGVNGETPAVKEELPELKLALLKDEEGNILDVLAISEKPKELNGYKYTGKEKEDSEGNKIYIYQKVELENINNKKQDTIVVNQSQVLKENIESKPEITTDKNDKKTVDKILPNTGETPLEHGVLGGMLLAATMILAKRKVKK